MTAVGHDLRGTPITIGQPVKFSAWGWQVRSWMVGRAATVVGHGRGGLIRVRFSDPYDAHQYGKDTISVRGEQLRSI